jgi:hypothetical protein
VAVPLLFDVQTDLVVAGATGAAVSEAELVQAAALQGMVTVVPFAAATDEEE